MEELQIDADDIITISNWYSSHELGAERFMSTLVLPVVTLKDPLATNPYALVRTILLNGCETWPVCALDLHKVEVFDSFCLRRILLATLSD